jgi:hypothetical protein
MAFLSGACFLTGSRCKSVQNTEGSSAAFNVDLNALGNNAAALGSELRRTAGLCSDDAQLLFASGEAPATQRDAESAVS